MRGMQLLLSASFLALFHSLAQSQLAQSVQDLPLPELLNNLSQAKDLEGLVLLPQGMGQVVWARVSSLPPQVLVFVDRCPSVGSPRALQMGGRIQGAFLVVRTGQVTFFATTASHDGLARLVQIRDPSGSFYRTALRQMGLEGLMANASRFARCP